MWLLYRLNSSSVVCLKQASPSTNLWNRSFLMQSLSTTLSSSTRTRCPNCGRPLYEGASFCVACSDTMQMPVVKEQTFLYLPLPLGAFVLWLVSLHSVQIRAMNDLGLVSVLPASNLVALALLVISFVLVLRRRSISVP